MPNTVFIQTVAAWKLHDHWEVYKQGSKKNCQMNLPFPEHQTECISWCRELRVFRDTGNREHFVMPETESISLCRIESISLCRIESILWCRTESVSWCRELVGCSGRSKANRIQCYWSFNSTIIFTVLFLLLQCKIFPNNLE